VMGVDPLGVQSCRFKGVCGPFWSPLTLKSRHTHDAPLQERKAHMQRVDAQTNIQK
jgi:hypothetical protein